MSTLPAAALSHGGVLLAPEPECSTRDGAGPEAEEGARALQTTTVLLSGRMTLAALRERYKLIAHEHPLLPLVQLSYSQVRHAGPCHEPSAPPPAPAAPDPASSAPVLSPCCLPLLYPSPAVCRPLLPPASCCLLPTASCLPASCSAPRCLPPASCWLLPPAAPCCLCCPLFSVARCLLPPAPPQTASNMGQKVVRECRGMILEKGTWDVVALPFLKFFNAGEKHAAVIDWTSARVYEKLDGRCDAQTK